MPVGEFHVRLSASAAGVRPGAAFRWWSDFRSGTVRHGAIRTRRNVLERRADGGVRMEDRTLFFRERLTAVADERALEVRFAGENTVSTFTGAYRFEPDGDGTRVVLETTIRPRGPLARLRPIAEPAARALLAHDLREHVADLARDLAR